MKKYTQTLPVILVVMSLLLSACGVLPALQANLPTTSNQAQESTDVSEPSGAANEPAEVEPVTNEPSPVETSPESAGGSSLLAAYEGTLGDIYTRVNPSVVNIRVVQQQSLSELDPSQWPFGEDTPQFSDPQTPQYRQGLGSGFVWDLEGHIVTNNHVVEGANKIEVTFEDGTTLPATLVGADSYSDLAVIQVEGADGLLVPVEMATEAVKVGELAIAIGNPYGLEGTMTAGIISAIGRTLATETNLSAGGSYSIPNIIQTDAPINPGNSGGVLVNDQGQIIGVNTAIESSTNSNSGIGFAIPATIVSKVVPALIESGTYEHPYIGISMINLTPDLVKAMNLTSGQRGVLVVTVAQDAPAGEAGLRPSQETTIVDGQEYPIGGDVITAIDGQAVAKSDDIIAFLNDSTVVGQSITLTLLRNGEETQVDLTLAARPAAETASVQQPSEPADNPEDAQTPEQSNAWLGILGAELTPALSTAMDLTEDQQGILILQVEKDSPAEAAGLKGSLEEVTIEGQTLSIGGDIITAVNGETVTTLAELRNQIRTYQPGTEIVLSILRSGEAQEVSVTLAERPSIIP